jgi:DNA-binding MarR family transcriptional regulator
MIKAELLERQECPTDRRGAFAHITVKGKAAHKRARAVYMRSLERNLGSLLSPSEAESLREALDRLS